MINVLLEIIQMGTESLPLQIENVGSVPRTVQRMSYHSSEHYYLNLVVKT
jgi:hypothetical protein